MVPAIVRITKPVHVADNEPNDQEAVHDDKERRREIQPGIVLISEHRDFK